MIGGHAHQPPLLPPAILPLARLHSPLLRRLALHGDHERPAEAAEGPRCRQGVPSRLPVRLASSEPQKSKSAARKREAAIKKPRRAEKDRLVASGDGPGIFLSLSLLPHSPPAHAQRDFPADRPTEGTHPCWPTGDAGWLPREASKPETRAFLFGNHTFVSHSSSSCRRLRIERLESF